jgi:hypothetical protein
MRRFDKDKNIEKANLLAEQRYLDRGTIKEDSTSSKNIDLANSNDTGNNICDDMSSNTIEELIELINDTRTTPEDRVKIKIYLKKLKATNDIQSNDGDNVNTVQHKIANMLCR